MMLYLQVTFAYFLLIIKIFLHHMSKNDKQIST